MWLPEETRKRMVVLADFLWHLCEDKPRLFAQDLRVVLESGSPLPDSRVGYLDVKEVE